MEISFIKMMVYVQMFPIQFRFERKYPPILSTTAFTA